MAWVNKNYISQDSGVTVPNASTDYVISKHIPVASGDSPIVVDVTIVSGTGTLKLQDSSDGFTTSVTKAKTAAISGSGVVRLTLLADLSTDQANYPIRNAIRVTADASSTIVISKVIVVHEK